MRKTGDVRKAGDVKQAGAVLKIRIILIQIQDVKKFVTDPDPGRTLIQIWIRIQAKMIRIWIQK